jgi:BMFP domain-containing protein YqiC
MDPRFLDDLAKRLAASLPEGLHTLRRDLESNFHAVLQSGLAKLDLVTRAEFDAQTQVLRRAREQLSELERRIQELEGAETGSGR